MTNLLFQMNPLLELLAEYDAAEACKTMFKLWRQYMDMVSILLRFTRAMRDGSWQLHLTSIAEMMPWFAVYYHVNYARWFTVFMADMKQLEASAPEVYHGFLSGDCVVKESRHVFNRLPDDQGLEHINRIGKVARGLVGITRSDSARDRWSLTYMERSRLAHDTRVMFGLVREGDDAEYGHKDTDTARMIKDQGDVSSIREQFQRFHVFDLPNLELICLTTGDVTSDEISKDLLNASDPW